MCMFHVTSKTDSFNEFVKATSLPVYWSYENGDKSSAGRRPPSDHYALACSASDKEWRDLPGQVSDAIEFLKRNFNEIERLCKLHRIDDIRFDFPVESRLVKEGLFSQCDFLPLELIGLAAHFNMGIEISQYWPSEDDARLLDSSAT